MSKLLEVVRLAGKPIKGVALVPVYQYPLTGYSHRLRGKFCVFLGRERSGGYRGKLNFFGGKVAFGEAPMEALDREVAEEMCVKLTPEVLDRCMVDTQLIPRRGWFAEEYFTLLVFVHITGIRRKVWSDIARERQRQRMAYALREMTEVLHLPIEDIVTRRDVSSYITENATSISNAIQLLSADNSVAFDQLEHVLLP